VELIRGIPTLVLVFYIVLALIPESVKLGNEVGADLVAEGTNPFGIPAYLEQLKIRDIDPEYRAVVALAISYSAFLSEIFRAGIESIDDGQRQAARSLGMSGWQVMRLVILPQAIRNILPPLGNDFIAMLKESSLVSVVGVADITRKGRDFGAATFTVFPGYNTIAMTYLVLTLVLSMLVKGLEWYLGRSRQQRE
jgi:polar amino acid transport system permease protein